MEDIAITCRRLAVLKQGQIAYQGPVSGLIDIYRGQVYEVVVAEGEVKEKLASWGERVLTTRQQDGGRMVRLLGEVDQAQTVTPSLEDAYLALIRS